MNEIGEAEEEKGAGCKIGTRLDTEIKKTRDRDCELVYIYSES